MGLSLVRRSLGFRILFHAVFKERCRSLHYFCDFRRVIGIYSYVLRVFGGFVRVTGLGLLEGFSRGLKSALASETGGAFDGFVGSGIVF